ncbi:hydroxymethylglutaryl-CoA reductase, degradative [Aureitalea marina]|uniref:3-hydroxy-3-methylglutaryl coenzyme A reductase n=1 Tax=Aureitalea marina TaxID=930804 RepID=A0A2S7KLS8_9FLAO|nr:hydroxymethylglutaryl-CoA reductase, degradative [Aureitalea marina]PQB03558.1 hydroxymethylglutaryl-CoA reductase, degradative [Aureitalea marina]
MPEAVIGFSKLSKEQKIDWLVSQYLSDSSEARSTLKQYWNSDDKLQTLHDEFIENSISNYYLPYGIAPNFLINERLMTLPMVIEESSVVAAASNAAKFWLDKGGFKAEVISTVKAGQIHINYPGPTDRMEQFFQEHKMSLIDSVGEIQRNMKKRGGGLIDLELKDSTAALAGYYQLHATFQTKDAMGANFINSCLEQIASTLRVLAKDWDGFGVQRPEVVMSILSNYVPNCLVKASVSCPLEQLANNGLSGDEFARKMVQAVQIAEVEVSRAVTHNKGIMNGVDALVLATGNDFRAVEAGVHAFAARSGRYTSLTHAEVVDGQFKFWIELPLALGTVGGLTSLHPLVRLSLDVLGKPSAQELMEIVAVAGLAQNFAALRSLVTIGIQQGHMKMHLMNILNQLGASPEEKELAIEHFKKEAVSFQAASEFISRNRE